MKLQVWLCLKSFRKDTRALDPSARVVFQRARERMSREEGGGVQLLGNTQHKTELSQRAAGARERSTLKIRSEDMEN